MNRRIDTYSDEELLNSLNGKQKLRELAFRELFNRYSKRIYFYCRKFLGNDEQAEDITQETFLNLLNYFEKQRKIENLPSFIFRIARNLCINSKRSNTRLEIRFNEEIIHPVDDEQNNKELAEIISSALELLPDSYREAFTLQMYCGMSYAEIAEMNDVPVSTVRNWIVRAKTKLRKILTPYLNEIY